PFAVGDRPFAGVGTIGVEQLKRHTADPLFGIAIEAAVVRAVVINPARQVDSDVFAKIVIDGVLAVAQQDMSDLVVSHLLSTRRSDSLFPVVVALRLMLVHLVFARSQVVEAITAVGTGVG